VEADRHERERRDEAVDVERRRRLTAVPNGRDLTTSPATIDVVISR
jgi:hypothetical protein